MSDAERKQLAGQLIDSYVEFRVMAELPVEILAFLLEVERNPTQENLERLRDWNINLQRYIAQKAESARPSHQPQPEMVASRTFFVN